MGPEALHRHLLGQDHLARAEAGSRFHCPICRKGMTGPESFNEHVRGGRHLREVERKEAMTAIRMTQSGSSSGIATIGSADSSNNYASRGECTRQSVKHCLPMIS